MAEMSLPRVNIGFSSAMTLSTPPQAFRLSSRHCAPPKSRPGLRRHPFQEGATLYRTGDLVRWLQQGALDYVGQASA